MSSLAIHDLSSGPYPIPIYEVFQPTTTASGIQDGSDWGVNQMVRHDSISILIPSDSIFADS